MSFLIERGTYAHIHGKPLTGMALVDTPDGSDIAVVAAVRDANVLEPNGRAQSGIEPEPAFAGNENLHPRV